MSRRSALLAFAVFVAGALPAAPVEPSGLRLDPAFGKRPFAFEENRGQTDPSVKFQARGPGYSLFLTGPDAVLALGSGDDRATLRIQVVGANARAAATGEELLPGRSHYLVGNDRKRWRTDVPQFARVTYRSVYPGIDLTWYGKDRQLEYDFVLAPGADPRLIRLRFDGAEDVRIEDGRLVARVGGMEVVQQAPVIYQEIEGERRTIEGRYARHANGEIGFVLGGYDRRQRLVIDPVLGYSTYLGGSGQDWGYAIARDASGNVYVTGRTPSSDFPTRDGYSGVDGGADDVFVTKLSPTGELGYSTYLGGAMSDVAYGIAVDASGNVYVAGDTTSPDFPTQNPYQASLSGLQDAFVVALAPSGMDLVYATYLGGSGYDGASGIAVDGWGSAYVAGGTASTDFPTANAYQTVGHGDRDAFVTRLTPSGSALVFSTYLGGSRDDFGKGIAVDGSGNAYVAGQAYSIDFPTKDPIRASHAGRGVEAFVSKFTGTGTLVYSTYFGTDEGEVLPQALAVDGAGGAYVTGQLSVDFENLDLFVVKLNPAGSAFAFTEFLTTGNEENPFRGISGMGIAVDRAGNAYVTGTTSSIDPGGGDVSGLECRGLDVFLGTLSPSGAWSQMACLGGSGYDAGFGVTVDGSGNAYLTGVTGSYDFPTARPLQGTHAGGELDVFVAKLSSYSPPPPRARPDFNGDGHTDIVWRHAVSGANAVWFMEGASATGLAMLPAVDTGAWSIVGIDDFNGDGRDDLLWHDLATGQVAAWYLDGTRVVGLALGRRVDDTNWRVAGVGDFNADGKPDILWRNLATGMNALWYLDGLSILGTPLIDAEGDLSWYIAGVGDFNGDGKPDIVWHNRATGANRVWLMNGAARTETHELGLVVPDLDWVPVQVADLNRDGTPDLVFRHQRYGVNAVAFFNGATWIGTTPMTEVTDTNWLIVPSPWPYE